MIILQITEILDKFFILILLGFSCSIVVLEKIDISFFPCVLCDLPDFY